jgi:putative transposase
MLISIPPKYAGSQVVGYMKGKSAIRIARTFLGRRKNYSGMSFWARGYFVSTVGADEEVVRACIHEQEQEDHRVEQLQLFRKSTTEWWSENLLNMPLRAVHNLNATQE